MCEKQDRSKMDLDTLLITEIGQFGRYQIRSLLIIAPLIMFSAWSASEYVFTCARINTRCLIPECETPGSDLVFSPAWLDLAVPSSSDSFDNCRRYSHRPEVEANATCSASVFDHSALVDCDEYVYENKNTAVYDLRLLKLKQNTIHTRNPVPQKSLISLGLACNEWLRSFIGTARVIGSFIALPIVGFISDKYGRRTAICGSAFVVSIVGITRFWANSYAGYLTATLVESMLGAGSALYTSAYVFGVELAGPNYRVLSGSLCKVFFASGQVTLGLLAWAVPNWRYLTLTLYIPQLLTIFYLFILAESVRWYLSNGKFQEAEKYLKHAAKINGKELSDKSLEALIRCETEKQKVTEADDEWLIVTVFRHKRILVTCLATSVWWFTSLLQYYGMSINAVNIAGNPYLNYVAVSAIEIPGFLGGGFLINKFGRKWILFLGYWICALCMITYMFLPSDMTILSLIFYMLGKLAATAVSITCYTYTAELYPTKYRHRLLAFSSMMGRFGAMLAPLTPALGDAIWDDLPFALFAGAAIIASCLVFLTPETNGCKLPDTIEEAEALGQKPQMDKT